MDHSFLIS